MEDQKYELEDRLQSMEHEGRERVKKAEDAEL